MRMPFAKESERDRKILLLIIARKCARSTENTEEMHRKEQRSSGKCAGSTQKCSKAHRKDAEDMRKFAETVQNSSKDRQKLCNENRQRSERILQRVAKE